MTTQPNSPKFVTLPEIRRAARERLPREVYNFGAGGSETETTMRRNRRSIDRLAIRQNVLVDVRRIDLSTSLLGVPLSWPVAIAPMGGLVLFHPQGDCEMARGAAAANTLQWLSGATGWPVEDVAKAASGPKMFQLYAHGDRGWMGELLARVESSGYHAVALTVDVQKYSRRERDVLARWSPREAMAVAPNPRGPEPNYQERLTWDDVEWMMKITKLPIGLKGIMTPRDAKRAVDMGVRLIWVSNHGGRQLDHGRGSLAVLPEVVRAVGGRAKVWVDGGFVRGTDIVKGIALGAEVVGLGRIACMGLAAAADSGLVRVLELLEEEVRLCLGLLGVTRFDELDGSYLAAETPVTPASVVSAFPLLDLDADRH
jgi:glycolate oxidase